MPIYAYRCDACGHAKDVLQKLSDPVLSTCPACGADAFRKQLTAAGFQLKGSGWYVTDFKGAADAAKNPEAPAAAPGDAKPADAKPGDAKPGEAKPGDAKPGDAKPGEAKPGDAKPAESAAAPAAAPAAPAAERAPSASEGRP